MNRQAWFAIELRKWGKPQAVAKKLQCSVAVVLAAMRGNEKAYCALYDGSASSTGRRLFLFPVVFNKMNTVDRKKRPRGMSVPMWKKIVSIFDEAIAG